MVRDETRIDFVLVDKNNRMHLKDMKAIILGIAASAGGNSHILKKVEDCSEERKNSL